MTSLTVNGSAVSGTTLATCAKMFNTTGGTSGSTSTKVAQHTTYQQIYGKGSTSTASAVGSIPAPTDANFHGWIWDVTTLEGQTIAAGTWTPTFHMLASDGGTITPTVEWFKRSSAGAYTSIGSVTGSSIALTTSAQLLVFTAPSLALMDFATGDTLVMWLWANITVASGSATGTMSVVEAISGSTSGTASEAQAATPGYAPTPVALTVTIPGVGTLTGTVALATALTATIAGVGTLTGTLSTSSSGVALSVTMASVGTLSPTLAANTALTTTLPGVGTLAGTFSLATALTSTIPGVGTLAPTLAANTALATTIPGVGTLTGTLSASVPLAVTIPGVGTLTGTFGHTYYVSPTGLDSNAGTSGAPWQTLAKVASTLVAGDTALFNDGSYTGQVNFSTSGTASTPITLKSINKWGATLIESSTHGLTSYVIDITGSYVILDGFEITGPDDRYGVLIEGSYVEVKNCWIHDCVTLYDPGSNGGGGIVTYSPSYNNNGILIHHNRVERIGTITGGVTVINQYVHTLYVTSLNAVAQSQVYDNLCIRSSGWGIAMYHNPNNHLVSNNTCINCKQGGLDCWGDTGSGYIADYNTIQNNIFMECGSGTWFPAIWSQSDSCGSHNIFRKNLAWFPGQTAVYDYTLANVNPLQTDTNVANADPLFVNYINDGTGNYHLQLGSPAIDTGTSTLAPSLDYDGYTRPQGSGTDIGAFEYLILAVTLVGQGTLSGTPSKATALSTTLVGVGTLTGTFSIATALSTTLVGVGTLTATLSTTSGVSLSVTMAGVGTLTGTETLSTALTTTLAGVGTLSGTITESTALAVTLAGVGTLTGTMTESTALAVTEAGVGTLAGTLTVGNTVALAATIAGVGTFTPSAFTEKTALTTTLAGVGTLAPSLVSNLTLPTDTLTGVGTLAGALTLSTALGCTFAGTGTLSGVYSLRVALFLTCAGVGTIAGTVTVPILTHITIVWMARDLKATWTTRDMKTTWTTRDEKTTWKVRG